MSDWRAWFFVLLIAGRGDSSDVNAPPNRDRGWSTILTAPISPLGQRH